MLVIPCFIYIGGYISTLKSGCGIGYHSNTCYCSNPLPLSALRRQVLVTTYNPRNPNISQIIRNNWNIIENTEDLQQIFPNKPLIGYRRLPNLRDILTSNKISWPPKEIKTNNSKLPPVCTRLGKCTYCPRLHKINAFHSTHTKRIHKCTNLPEKHRITCEIYNIPHSMY